MTSSYCAREGTEGLKNSHPFDGDSSPAGGGSGASQRSEGSRRASRYDVVVMDASAGGVKALQTVLSALPAGFPVPIAVVLHRSAKLPNLLARVQARRTLWTVKMAEPSGAMRAGTVYLASPDLHLTVDRDGSLNMRNGRKIRHVRSSANPLFESAAETLGERVIAVVLTGDETDGVQSVKAHGETIIAQDEGTAQCFGMSHAAIETGCVDWILPLEKIGPTLVDQLKAPKSPTGDVH